MDSILSKPTGMILDGVAASEAIDSSGEVLDVKGCDISTLPIDGVINYEHVDGGAKDTKAFGQEVVGRILHAKKVFGLGDCDTDREEEYWRKVKLPFIYIIYRLYDGAGHEGAKALAASIRDALANDEPILVRLSVEGSTLERDGNKLVSSVARRVAATYKPCNRTCVVGVLADPNAPEGFEKRPVDPSEIRGSGPEIVEKREHQHPLYTRLGGSAEIECNPVVGADVMDRLRAAVKDRMAKALEAGTPGGAPSTLTGGAALQREDRGLKARALAALRDFGSKKKFDKSEFRAFCKTYLPEASDDFVDHFADVAEDYHVKRSQLQKQETEKKAKTPKKVASTKKPKAPELPEEPDNLLADDAPAASADDFDFPTTPTVAPKLKKLKATDILPAKGRELKDALAEATNMHQGQFKGMSPIVRNGVELKGMALARYLSIPEPAPQTLTIQGRPARPPQASSHVDVTKCRHSIYEPHGKECKPELHKATEAHYNFDTGYLNVPARPARFNMRTGQWVPGHTGGYFKQYMPGHYDPALHGSDPVEGQKKADKEKADFMNLLEDPERTKWHDSAMSNWVIAHNLMKQGKLPDVVPAYMTAFSMLSPNTPVPVHEMMMSYLVDSMKHTGVDIRDPKFAGARGHLLTQDLKEGRATGKRPDVRDPQKYGNYGDWKSRDTGDPNKLPEHAPDHSQRTLHNITVKQDQKADPDKGKEARKAGQLMSFMLAQNKFVNMAGYHKYHKDLSAMFNKLGPEELGGQQIVNYMLHHKEASKKFEAAKKRALKSRKPTFDFGGEQHPVDAEYPYGFVVRGLAPKTSRLTATMAGDGTMHVNDTHQNRYNFGLAKGRGGDDDDEDEDEDGEVDGFDDGEDQDDPTANGPMDNKSISSIKKVLWRAQNHHVVNAMDRYFEKHSPAVPHMVERWGHWLHGTTPEEKRRNAVFGAFWKTWAATRDHEISRGMWSSSKNDYSDHGPAWRAVADSTATPFIKMHGIAPFLVLPNLKKGEPGSDDDSLPLRCALIHGLWEKKFGSMHAHQLAMVHLLPQLLMMHAINSVGSGMRKAEVPALEPYYRAARGIYDRAAKQELETQTMKFEAIEIDLRKAMAEEAPAIGDADYQDHPVFFGGHSIIPGSAIGARGKYALLHEDATYYTAVPHEKVRSFDVPDLVRLPKAKKDTHYWVISRPAVPVSDIEE